MKLPIYKFLFFFLFIFLSADSNAQFQTYIDSVLPMLPKMKNDTQKVNSLNVISQNYSYLDSRKGIQYGEQALTLAEKLNWKKGMANAYNFLGMNYAAQSNYPKALECYLTFMKISESIGNKPNISSAANNIGNIYTSQNEHLKALAYYNKAVEINDQIGNRLYKTVNIGNIGDVYRALGNYPLALRYYFEAVKMAKEEVKYQSLVYINMESIAVTYMRMANYSEALKYFLNTLEILAKFDDKSTSAYTNTDVGEMYLQMFKDSTLIKKDKEQLISKSLNYLEAAAKISKEIEDLDTYQRTAKLLSEVYSIKGNYIKALFEYKEYSLYKDSVFSQEKTKELTRKEMDYVYDKAKDSLKIVQGKKDLIASVELNRQKNFRNIFLAGSTFLLIVTIGAGYAYRQKRRDNKTISIEKKRSEDLLLNILPPEIAEELKDNGTSTAKLYSEVTILFTDFVNFTGISSGLSPQVLVRELHECFTAFDAIIEKNGLEKIKTIGDAYMAVCGLPISNDQHAQNTVKAALEIRDFIIARKKENGFFEIKIGINSGEVVAGIVGAKKFAYDIWGDAVNIAARIEQNGESGKVNISESTFKLVKENFNCEYRGKIEAKNKGAIAMYFVNA